MLFFDCFLLVFHFLFRLLFHFVKRKVRKSLQCKGLQTFFVFYYVFHFVFHFVFRFLICIKELLFYNRQRKLLIRINHRFLLIQIVLNPWRCPRRQLTLISNFEYWVPLIICLNCLKDSGKLLNLWRFLLRIWLARFHNKYCWREKKLLLRSRFVNKSRFRLI